MNIDGNRAVSFPPTLPLHSTVAVKQNIYMASLSIFLKIKHKKVQLQCLHEV